MISLYPKYKLIYEGISISGTATLPSLSVHNRYLRFCYVLIYLLITEAEDSQSLLMLTRLRAMHPFSPMLFLSAFNHCYIAIIRCPPLMAVFLHCFRLPWGLREGWRLRCFFNLNYSQGTKVVSMTNWGSTLFFLKIIANEAAGLALGCRDSHFSLQNYSINIQLIFRYLKQFIYIKKCSRTLCVQRWMIKFWWFGWFPFASPLTYIWHLLHKRIPLCRKIA